MKNTITCVLCLAIMISTFPLPANAAEINSQIHTTITTFEDGSYCVTTITEATTGTNTNPGKAIKTGTKTSRYYDANDNLLFAIRLKGTFTYDGTTATAIAAQFGYSIYDSAWSFVSGSSSCVGATASATCIFKLTAAYTKTLSVSLTCSATGTLS